MNSAAETYITKLTTAYPDLLPLAERILTAAFTVAETAKAGNAILICGNGGSSADADHIAGELMKSFRIPRPLDVKTAAALEETDSKQGRRLAMHLQEGVPVIVLSGDSALSTAVSNDTDPYLAFAQQTCVYGKPGDLLIALSTSGNAENVELAAITARAKGMQVLGLTGADGGNLKRWCDQCISVPREETYAVQELHLPVYHTICLITEELLWGKGHSIT